MHFFILLAIYLVAEGWALASVAGHTGWLAAIALIFLVSMGGAYLVRRQGVRALVKIQASLAKNESPDAELLDGLFIFAAGLLLFLPGFLSDIAGIILLIPLLRRLLAPWLLRHLKTRVASGRYIKTYTVYDYEWRESGAGAASPEREPEGGLVIDIPSRRITGARPEDKKDAGSDKPSTSEDSKP